MRNAQRQGRYGTCKFHFPYTYSGARNMLITNDGQQDDNLKENLSEASFRTCSYKNQVTLLIDFLLVAHYIAKWNNFSVCDVMVLVHFEKNFQEGAFIFFSFEECSCTIGLWLRANDFFSDIGRLTPWSTTRPWAWVLADEFGGWGIYFGPKLFRANRSIGGGPGWGDLGSRISRGTERNGVLHLLRTEESRG